MLLTLMRSNLSDLPFLILVSNLRTLYLSLGPKGFVLVFPKIFVILYLSSLSHFSWFLSEVSAWDWGGGSLVWLLPEDVRFLLHHLLKTPSFLYSIAFVSLSVITCKLFHYKFNSNSFRINQLIYFILVELMVVCSFWKLDSSPLSCQIMSIKLFVLKVFLYCPCNICRHHSDSPCYISLPILAICVFSLFISANLKRGLLILLIVVQRTSSFFHWFFSIAFLFSITLISGRYCFFWLLLVYFTPIFLVLEEET